MLNFAPGAASDGGNFYASRWLLSWSEMPACLLPRAGMVSFDLFQPYQLRKSHSCNSLGKQNGLVDRLRHLTAQMFAGDVVGAEMLPSVNAAQSCFLGRRWEASEVPYHSR